jgi:hypothetical protein
MIKLGKEPEGFLLRRGDILSWLPGLTKRQWKKIRPTLIARKLPGCTKPYYSKVEVAAKLITPHSR